MEKCYFCGKGKLVKKKEEYSVYGVSLGKFDAEVCDKCGEIFFSEEVSDKIAVLAKKKNLFGLEAKTKIGQSGSTLDIRLPKKIIEFMKIKKGKEATLHPEGKNKLVVEF